MYLEIEGEIVDCTNGSDSKEDLIHELIKKLTYNQMRS